ncbi:hypothetical protein pdul_cds_75 [Pandoravirus dulcis]|uniref:Uncharacterized protein n=1 Tax=Pandoravirus dulcis TaxID=1349409 RepID=S4VP01_9VIRU|nr:hypothetical protein pdul_cds_75 [Pandoravirus dulcis]AGO81967.2 hypothetical protein pdul_cds_75 [Pandoravirus dulcis]
MEKGRRNKKKVRASLPAGCAPPRRRQRARLPKSRATNDLEEKKARQGQGKSICKQKHNKRKKKKKDNNKKKGGRVGARRKKRGARARALDAGRLGSAKNSARGPGRVSRPCTRGLDQPHKGPFFPNPLFQPKKKEDEPRGRDRDIATNTKKRSRTSVAVRVLEER